MSNQAASEQFLAQANRIIGLLATIPLEKVRFGILLVLVIWFLSLLADIVWLLVPAPNVSADLALTQAKTTPRMQVQKNTQDFDIKTMQGWHLFGTAELVVAESNEQSNMQSEYDKILEDAQATRLQLILMGVIVSIEEGAESYAIIEHQSLSELYKVGDSLPGGRDVTLAWVLSDRVIINNHGVRESLMLYDEDPANPSQKPQVRKQNKSAGAETKKILDQRGNDRLSDMANGYRKQLIENPMSLADVIKISVAKNAEGAVIGYRIRPGRDRQQFNDFGLKSGDIVTSINGLALDDPSKAMELYGQLRDAKEASFVVKRGEEEINLIVGLSE